MGLNPMIEQEPKSKKFKTVDGYLLSKIEKDGHTEWTDGDLTFDDENGHPVDFMQEKLEGQFI